MQSLFSYLKTRPLLIGIYVNLYTKIATLQWIFCVRDNVYIKCYSNSSYRKIVLNKCS